MDNMEDAICAFKKANPKSADVRAFVVDKDFKERTLLKRHFPTARILLCHYHVIKIFAKKVGSVVRSVKNRLVLGDSQNTYLHRLKSLCAEQRPRRTRSLKSCGLLSMQSPLKCTTH
jgi:hypothetical protein